MRPLFLTLALAVAAPGALGGAACSDAPPSPESVRKGLQLALMAFQALDAGGARLALIGRVGSDLAKHELRYSHIGMVVRDHAKGRWTVVHNHPNELRFSDQIYTVTVESIVEFARRFDPATRVTVLKL